MKLPFLENAYVPEEKITQYLLHINSEKENARSKARFFLAFGFTIAAWQVMANALILHAHDYEVTSIVPRPPFGVNYVIEGNIVSPDKRHPAVRVIWAIDRDSELPRLVSAYPL